MFVWYQKGLLLEVIGLSYDDVLLRPRLGIVKSRGDVNLNALLVQGTHLSIPIVSAPMSTVTDGKMAHAMALQGGMGFIHRFLPIHEQAEEYTSYDRPSACAIGLKDGLYRMQYLHSVGCNIFCIDVAHAHNLAVKDFIENIPIALRARIKLIVGNVATAEGARFLANLGVDGIKVGIGPGSACTTREVTGFGVPQVTAICEIYQALQIESFKHITIIADGGIKNSGDIVKAIVSGANTVMLGRLLADTEEAPRPGEFFGMASYDARWSNSATTYTAAPEGVTTMVKVDKTVSSVISLLTKGVRSGVSYGGGKNLDDIRGNVEMLQVAPGVAKESSARI